MPPTRKAEVKKKETLKIQPVIKAIGKKPIVKKNTRKGAVILPPLRERLERGAKTAAVVKINKTLEYEKSPQPPTPASSPVLMTTVKIPSPILFTTKTPAPTIKKSLVIPKTIGKTVTFNNRILYLNAFSQGDDKIELPPVSNATCK